MPLKALSEAAHHQINTNYDSRRARTTSTESGRRVEVDSQSGTEILPDGESGRSGQEGVHMDGVRGGVHHGGGDARLDA